MRTPFLGFLGYMIVSARRGYHAYPDALENRARPLRPCAPAASDVFAYSERAACRVSCIGACLVSKVKDRPAGITMEPGLAVVGEGREDQALLVRVPSPRR